MTCLKVKGAVLCAAPVFQVGDLPPAEYGARHEWAAIQLRGGLRQHKCPVCGKWEFPQEKCCADEMKKKP